MMTESRYWKDELLKISARLRNFVPLDKMTDNDLGGLEKDLLIGFYSVRKLMEAVTKITDQTKAATLEVVSYPNTGPVTYLSRNDLSRIYNLGRPNRESRDAWFVSNLFIHSYILDLCADECEELQGVYVTSDHKKDTKLYHISIGEICTLFERVGNDWPRWCEWIKDDDGNEMIVVV